MIARCLGFTAVLVGLVAILVQLLPARYLLAPYMLLDEKDKPAMFINNIKQYYDVSPTPFLGKRVNVHVGPVGFILIVEADESIKSSKTNENITTLIGEWYHENHEWFNINVVKYGGIMLRNFPIENAVIFDHLLGEFHRDSSGTGLYLGTAPRQKIEGTRFVSTASDIPRLITIPTHIELSFTPNPPKRLYFYAEKPNQPIGGQTTYTDFFNVWNKELSEKTKSTLLKRGMLIERRYHDKNKLRPLDGMYSKTWQEMFQTNNQTLVNQLAQEQHFTPVWKDGKTDELILRHEQLVIRNHSITKQPYWATHFNVLHAETYEIPYAWSAQLFESKQSVLLAWMFVALYTIRHKILGLPYGHNMFYADNEESIEFSVAIEIRRAISRQTWIFDWLAGDVMILDNHRIAHGRSPWWKGDRKVYVAWN